MSILDRHPAPWTTRTLNSQVTLFVDANGDTVTTIDGYSGHASSIIYTIAAELAASRAENERLREALRFALPALEELEYDEGIERINAALRKAGVE